MVGPV